MLKGNIIVTNSGENQTVRVCRDINHKLSPVSTASQLMQYGLLLEVISWAHELDSRLTFDPYLCF